MSRARVAVVGLLLSGAAPASLLADNCDGLSDCGVAVKIALAVLAVLAVLVLLEVAPLLFGAELAAEAAAAEGAVAAEAAAEAAAMAEEIDIAIGIQEAIEAAEAAESAAAAAEASAAADVGTAEYLQAIARTVNSTRGTMNCQTCTQAVSRALGGELGSLAPHSNELVSLYGLAEEAGGSLSLQTTAAGIETEMAAAQAGEEAWVYVAAADGQVAHIFNAVNFAGEVFYVDGQLGVVGQSAAEVAAAAGYTGSDVMFYLVSFF